MKKELENLKAVDLLIYQWDNWEIILKNDIKNETIFASLDQIANIFGRDKSNIAKHIKNIYKTWELSQDQVVAFFATTALDWKTYKVEYFNLDMIISVWYRVNSLKATDFRKYVYTWKNTRTSLKSKKLSWFSLLCKGFEKYRSHFVWSICYWLTK
jgi:hypothetical protein